jgi:pyruvate/2-oxoglutarate dehydrogenase complex dihydrolipoamide acyltransferase (E2) component
MQKRHMALIAGLLVAIAGAGTTLWWLYRGKVVPPPPVAQAPAAPAPAPAAAPPTDAGPKHPLEPLAEASAPQALPGLDAAESVVREALAGLAGQTAVMTFLQADGFVRRAVVTVDNLARPMAASRLWPVQPTPGRLQRIVAGDVERIAADNARRYAPFVAFVASVEPSRAAAVYRRLYPLFQQAYAELGYPKGHFNDRLVEVIDHLMAAPEPTMPPAVRLVEVKGEVPSTRPWVRYEFADERLESLSSGQKIMVRIGNDHARRLKGWLAGFRQAIVSPR